MIVKDCGGILGCNSVRIVCLHFGKILTTTIETQQTTMIWGMLLCVCSLVKFRQNTQKKTAMLGMLYAGCLKQGSEASGREGVVVRETHTNMLETHSVRQTYTKHVENTQYQTNIYKTC